MEENKILPQPTVIIHVPGAGGNIGAKRALGEKPDGYTYLQTIVNLASNQALGNIDFGPADFIPVAAAGDSCIVISVMESSPYKSLKQLLDAAKAKPDTIVLGINIGGINHITARMMEEAYPGAKFRLANVGGGAKNFASLVGGHTETTPFSAADFTRFRVKGIRGLAYTGATRHPVLPEISTTKELGLPSIDFCFRPLVAGAQGYAQGPHRHPRQRTREGLRHRLGAGQVEDPVNDAQLHEGRGGRGTHQEGHPVGSEGVQEVIG